MSVNEEFLDEVFNKETMDNFELPKWWIDKTREALLQHFQQKQERAVKQARADQLKKLWNATQHDIVPEGTPPRDMSEELHKMIKELEE